MSFLVKNRWDDTSHLLRLPLLDEDEVDRLAVFAVRGPNYRLENKDELADLLARLRKLQGCVAGADNSIFGLSSIDVVRMRRCTPEDVKAEELHRWTRFANTMRTGKPDLSFRESEEIAAAIKRARAKWATESGAR
ncbi:MAG: hypothetical protein MJE77_43000 [Proteobacteria bacterium]|nr:hypothetical protein [Pseudomonadota bacterium]